jgi:hypothetical protein
MSAPDRRGRLDMRHKTLSVRWQCALLGLARSGVYQTSAPASEDDAAAMRRIDGAKPHSANKRRSYEPWHPHSTIQARIDRPVDKLRASHPLTLPRLTPQRSSRVR